MNLRETIERIENARDNWESEGATDLAEIIVDPLENLALKLQKSELMIVALKTDVDYFLSQSDLTVSQKAQLTHVLEYLKIIREQLKNV